MAHASLYIKHSQEVGRFKCNSNRTVQLSTPPLRQQQMARGVDDLENQARCCVCHSLVYDCPDAAASSQPRTVVCQTYTSHESC